MYKVKDKFKTSTVRITQPGKFGNKIDLATATQEQLEYLSGIGFVGVEKVEPKKKIEE